jgi:hypothetical protein
MRDRALWIVPLAGAWANLHISYYLGFVLLGIYTFDAQIAAWRREPNGSQAMATRLWAFGVAAAAASFLNPGGWNMLKQPFEFALFWRKDPMFQTIVELHPLMWAAFLHSGTPLLIAAWPLLALWRSARRGMDRVELLMCTLFTVIAISSQRFIGAYALAAAPFVARDLDSLLGPALARGPASPWARAAIAALACVVIAIPEWTRPGLPTGVTVDSLSVPIRACDMMAARGVRGRGINPLHYGGYQMYRFWPDRERLPMVSIHPEDTPADLRPVYIRAFENLETWQALDAQYHFDYALLDHRQDPGDHLLEFLQRDSTWTRIFWDDAADLLVRRGGRLDQVARRWGYRVVPAGNVAMDGLVNACTRDTALRAAARQELERAVGESRWNSSARRTLAVLAMMSSRFDEARAQLRAVAEQAPGFRGTHELLGVLLLMQHRPAEALPEFQTEMRHQGQVRGIALRIGQSYLALGDRPHGRAWLVRELKRYPDNAEARRALDALDAGADLR